MSTSKRNSADSISYLMDKVSELESKLQREKDKRRKREAELKNDLDHSWEELKNLGEALEAQKLENEKMRRFLEINFGFGSDDEEDSDADGSVGEDMVTNRDEEDDMNQSHNGDSATDESSSKDSEIGSLAGSLSSLRVNLQNKKRPRPSYHGSSQSSSPEKKKQRLSANNKDSTVKIKTNFFKCHLCPKEYPTKKKLDSHLRRRHNYEEPSEKELCEKATKKGISFKCLHCPKEYASAKSLREHGMRMHTPERKKLYYCPVPDCLRRNAITKHDGFIKHMNNFHGGPEGHTYKCDHCQHKLEFEGEKGIKEYMDHVDQGHPPRSQNQ